VRANNAAACSWRVARQTLLSVERVQGPAATEACVHVQSLIRCCQFAISSSEDDPRDFLTYEIRCRSADLQNISSDNVAHYRLVYSQPIIITCRRYQKAYAVLDLVSELYKSNVAQYT